MTQKKSQTSQSEVLLELKIYGELASKANSRRITNFGGHPRLIKSAKALGYEESAIPQIHAQLGARQPLEDSIVMEAHIYYASRRPDLDPSLLMDVLEHAGVYKNDRQIVEQHLFKYLDKENPRVIVRIRTTDYKL